MVPSTWCAFLKWQLLMFLSHVEHRVGLPVTSKLMPCLKACACCFELDIGHVPWIRVAVEKPTAGPGRAKEEGRRGRLWSPWTSLSGTAPIRINIQNLDVGFNWFISDRSREITQSLLCNLLSGRPPTNQSTQV